MNKINKVAEFLNNGEVKFAQVFNSRNTVNDYMKNVYFADGIMVDYCEDWDYIEVFGLTEDEFNLLKTMLIIRDRKSIWGY